MPVYELATKEDHIAPAKSVFTGAQLFGGAVEFVLRARATSPASSTRRAR